MTLRAVGKSYQANSGPTVRLDNSQKKSKSEVQTTPRNQMSAEEALGSLLICMSYRLITAEK